MEAFFGKFKKGSDAAAAAAGAAVSVENPFEVTCQKFNQFYAMMPLPNGRVRPTFPIFSPPNNPGVDYSFVAYGTPEFKGDLLDKFQILFLNQQMFQHYYKILQYFPCEEARNLESQKTKYGDKGNKYLNQRTSNFHLWEEMPAVVEDMSCVKKSFVYFVFDYIVAPVVNIWKSYTDEESEIDEQYLSALLQFELLNHMNNLLLFQKRNVYTHCGEGRMKIPNQYAPGTKVYSLQEQQVIDSLKQSLKIAIQQPAIQQLQQQVQRQQLEKQQKYWKEDIAKYYAANPNSGPYDYLGGSKRQRRQRSKRQRRQKSKRRRQKSKKYHK
jgi:hypothetical protein